MADNSLTQLLTLINDQVDSHETLSEYLSKAEALAQVALGDDFFDHPDLTVHYYLWTLSDLLSQARILNEHLINVLMSHRSQSPIETLAENCNA